MFKTVTEQVIMHSDTNEHDSYLKRIGVPMKPDRVIGLCTTPGMRDCVERSQWNLEHSPVKGTEMVYPFLVVEAKKERHAPGFRSIERQTAFPIRRLLHVQDELRNKASGSCHEPPLVWFFAYQGEEWRLYAGVFQSRTMFVSSSMDQKEKIVSRSPI